MSENRSLDSWSRYGWDYCSSELDPFVRQQFQPRRLKKEQQALSNASVHDFVIVEHQGDIGGRVAHTEFGRNPSTGDAYTVELGANWVQGLGTSPGPENPIWTLAKRYNVTNFYSNYSSILTYNATGLSDYSSLIDSFEEAYATYEQDAGYTLTQNLLDTSAQVGLTMGGWKPGMDMQAQAVDWWEMDWEYAYPPAESSGLFTIANYNATFYQYSDANNFVFDSRGFNTFIKGQASEFLNTNDPRLKLNTAVHTIQHDTNGVTVHARDPRSPSSDETCYFAPYALTTFSVGVLQESVSPSLSSTTPPFLTFNPPLPRWKVRSLNAFQMGTYTKIFLQWPSSQVFWDRSTQYFLYASPTKRGYYPLFQSLDHPDFLPGSGILFVTVVTEESHRVEAQPDEATKEEVLAVLRDMFGADNVPLPQAFMYPRWTQEPWARGSYSNWPVGMTIEEHQNLRANVGRLWFAGEATSAEYYGFLHGAWFEGQMAGQALAECVKGNATMCEGERRFEVLKGTSSWPGEFGRSDGWLVSSMQTNGFDDS
ncbi:MAG: hypothetical protein Q9227_000050 [Pyrenula ochraceoflavens]